MFDMGVTVINNDRLWLGIGSELVLLAALVFVLYFIFTAGKIRKDVFSSKGRSKASLWISIALIILAMVMVYFGMISSAVIKF